MNGLSRRDMLLHVPDVQKHVPPQRLILLAFVLCRHDAVFDCVGVKHYRDKVEEKETYAEACGRDRSQEDEDSYWNCAEHPQETREFVSLINMAQPGDDAQ